MKSDAAPLNDFLETDHQKSYSGCEFEQEKMSPKTFMQSGSKESI